jgi:hypothetical protein
MVMPYIVSSAGRNYKPQTSGKIVAGVHHLYALIKENKDY